MADSTQFRNNTTRYDPGMGLDLICDALNLGLYIGVDAAADASPTISSAIIKFLQSGIGAVATTVQAKARQWLSVKDFGTVGDGTAITNADLSTKRVIGAVTYELP